MKMKIFCFIVCTLLMTVTLTATSGNMDENYSIETNISYDDLIDYASDNNRFSNNWSEQAKLIASDGGPDDYFGLSVSINRQYAIVGAYEVDDGTGAAYIFRYNGTTWVEEQKLTASDGHPKDFFGRSVSICADYAIVGASHDTNHNGREAGAAYIFKNNGKGWIEEQKLMCSDGAPYDYFGMAVSINETFAIVNAWTMDYYGGVYIFKNTGPTWVEHQKLLPLGVQKGDRFGRSFSFYKDVAIFGAPSDDTKGENAGACYIYKKNGSFWSQTQKFYASDHTPLDYFGRSVSMFGDYAIIGAFLNTDIHVGYAYIFKLDGTTWGEEQKIVASDGKKQDAFGIHVIISIIHGSVTAFVAAPFDDDNKGSVYVFNRCGSTWVEDQKLNVSESGGFGYAISISGKNLFIGMPGDDNPNGENSGAAYIFKKSNVPELKIGTIKGGLFRVQSNIENIGILNATDVQWKIKLDGSAFIGKETTGTADIPAGGNLTINSRLILGFGPTKVTVMADAPDAVSDSKQQNGLILLFYIKVNPGSDK